MALIKCSECGKEISDKAKTCPNCGNAVTTYVKCSDCGEKFVSSDLSCSNCGCPNYSIRNYTNEDKCDSLCLSGMIVGIVSFFIDFFGLVSATGLTLSIIGYANAKNKKSKNIAIAGLACSGLELVLKFIQLMKMI